ncbi:MAG: L,D-transpeptidase family protein [Thermoleophilaceae bacterium]
MRKTSFILIAALLVLLVGGAVGVVAYDSSRKDTIAQGVTVAGVDVGDMSSAQARSRITAGVAKPLERPVAVTYGGRRYTVSAKEAGAHADVGRMVDEALARSRDGSIFSRVYRDVAHEKQDEAVPARVTYSKMAAGRLVSRVAKGVDQPAQDAKVEFPSLAQVGSKDGLRVDTAKLRTEVSAAIIDPDHRVVAAPVQKTKAKVTRSQLAKKYPTVLVLERASFKLKLYRNLKLTKAYTVAVGQQGLETPAGLYHIQNKGVNVPWMVPNSSWAGSLAGTTVPGGSPDNPLKARWMGIFAGAGIHGTDETGSLGRAASHGCVRMAIPDVIELYPQVPVEAPIYIG